MLCKYSKYGLLVSLMIIIISWSCNLVLASDYKIGDEESNCSSFLVISGKSNVNEFELTWSSGVDLNLINKEFSSEDTSYFTYSIPVKDFKANNFIMYDDFIRLMKAEEYPRIVLKISQDQLKELESGEIYINPEISITIAGVTNIYNVPCSIISCQGNTLMLNGMEQISLKDFNMTPPVKLQGLVKVEEEIDVSFGIIFKFTDPNQKIASN